MYQRLLDRVAALVALPTCAACTRPTDVGRRICARCTAELGAMPVGRRGERTFAAFPYAGPARGIVGALKFRQAPAVAGEMAELMLPRLPPWALDARWIVPAPAHPARRRQRGYNQSQVLARELARATGARVIDCLVRAPLAPPQSELSRADRLKLPSAAISVDRDSLGAIDPSEMLLCDDVITTGVTLERCAQALGAERAVTFAATVAFGPAGRIL
jgi:ComF family protein